jgi:serine/threonine protein kinase
MAGVARSGKKGGKGQSVELTTPEFVRFNDLEVGQVLDAAGELEYRGVAAEGDWSCVLKVNHKSSNSLRALRLVRPELVATEVQQRLFEEELERAAAVAGDFAARLFDMGTLSIPEDESSRHWWFLTMEWIEGRSLQELLGGGRFQQVVSFERYVDRGSGEGPTTSPLATEDALHFIEQAAEGLAELHRAGVCHFDLRPDELVLSKQGRLRLVGYGLAPELRQGLPALANKWRSSPYAPQELTRGEWAKLGPRADVFQLGMLAYELFRGAPCSPWVAYEELCETVQYLPAAMDELIQDCLDESERRPQDADAFLAAFREAAKAYDANQRQHRARSDRKAKDIWARAQAMAEREFPQWTYVAGMCQRLLEEKPHLLPFGKIPAKQVQALLTRAQEQLQARRRSLIDSLIAGQAWPVAEAIIDQLGGEVPSRELDELRLNVEIAQIEAPGKDAGARELAAKRIMDLMKTPNLEPVLRDKAAAVLEGLLREAPAGTHAAAQAAVPAPAEAPAPGAPRLQVLTELGSLAPVERFQVDRGNESILWRVIVGPAVRLGRGSYDEFGNHVDLRPTRREAAESSITLALAQRISRAGHLELRVGPDGLEAFCMGTHGAAIDGQNLRRGERATLQDEGKCLLAQGATEVTYKTWKQRDGLPVAVELTFTGGVGAGRHAVWALTALPLPLLCPDAGVKANVIPTPEGWVLECKQDSLALGHQTLTRNSKAPWPSDVVLELPEGMRVQHS